MDSFMDPYLDVDLTLVTWPRSLHRIMELKDLTNKGKEEEQLKCHMDFKDVINKGKEEEQLQHHTDIQAELSPNAWHSELIKLQECSRHHSLRR
jgi:hypothetical protein